MRFTSSDTLIFGLFISLGVLKKRVMLDFLKSVLFFVLVHIFEHLTVHKTPRFCIAGAIKMQHEN